MVLLADDEDAVRWLGRRFLEADGWAVLEARDGEEALQIIESLTGRSTWWSPTSTCRKVSGRELAEVLSVFRPGLPVLGITGFLSAVNHDRRLPILPKPFTPGSLLQAVRMACGLSVRLRRPPLENRRRARRLRELTPAGAPAAFSPRLRCCERWRPRVAWMCEGCAREARGVTPSEQVAGQVSETTLQWVLLDSNQRPTAAVGDRLGVVVGQPESRAKAWARPVAMVCVHFRTRRSVG